MPTFINTNKEFIDGPAPVTFHMGNGVMGSYDNLVLYNKDCGWRKPPCNVPQYKEPVIYQGHQLPLKHDMVTMPLPKKSMFMFQKNRASLACCPSTYSTGSGCICTNEQQRNLVGVKRGNNKRFPTNPMGL